MSGGESKLLERINELKQQVLLAGKEIDDLRRQYLRFVEQVKHEDNLIRKENHALKNMVLEFGDTLTAFDKILLAKGVYTDEEFRHVIITNFIEKNKLEIINDAESLEKGDLAFIKFKCEDASGNILFMEPYYTKYQIGIGILPFESQISTVHPGTQVEFTAEFQANFFNPNVAGKTVKVTYDSYVWLRAKGTVAQAPAPVVPLNPAAVKDKPMSLNDEGELS